MGLDGAWKEAWNSYTEGLVLGGICLTTQSDSLVWDFNKKDGSISAKHAYECIVNSYPPPIGNRIDSLLWSSALPDSQHYWYTAEELGLGGAWKEA